MSCRRKSEYGRTSLFSNAAGIEDAWEARATGVTLVWNDCTWHFAQAI
jgi:hypothetical protein